MSRNFSCYILQLRGGKFYVGSTLTRNVQRRFEMHRDGDGAKWCRDFPPIRVIRVIDNLTSQEAFKREDTECVRIMKEHNDMQCCRGGSYNFPVGSDWWYRQWGKKSGEDPATAWLAAH